MIVSLFYCLYALFPVFALHLPNLMASILVLMALCSIVRKINYRRLEGNCFIYAWSLFVMIGVLSIAGAREPSVSATELFKLLAMLACCYLTCQWLLQNPYLGWKIRKNFLLGWMVALVVLALEVVSNGALKQQVDALLALAPSSPINALNKAACAVAIGMWMLIFAAQYAVNGRKRLWYAAVFYALLAALVLIMDSESAKIGLLGGSLVFVLCALLPQCYRYLALMASVGLLLVPIILYIYMEYGLDLLPMEIAYSWDHRLYIAFNVLYLIRQQPFLGWGFGSSKALDAIDQGYVAINEVYGAPHRIFNMHPHNNSLQILVETGCIGLFSYCLAAVCTICLVGKSKWLRQEIKPYIQASFCTYLIIGSFNFSLWASWFEAMILLTCLMAVTLNKELVT